MKRAEMEALKNLLSLFEDHLSQQALLLKEFKEILDSVNNETKKRGYRQNPDYYKAKVREWEKRNPEKIKEYNKRHQEKKKAERLARILDLVSQGKSIPEISVLLMLSEKKIINCIKKFEQTQSDLVVQKPEDGA